MAATKYPVTSVERVALASKFGTVFIRGQELPAPVFKPGYHTFSFIEFVEMSGGEFWHLLQRLACWSQDTVINLVDSHIDFVKAGELGDDSYHLLSRIAGTAEDYKGGLIANDRRLDGMLAGAWFPDSCEWGIWGELTVSTLVVGFRRPPPKPFAELAAECGLRPWTLDEILHLAQLDFGIFPREPAKPANLEAYEKYCAEFRRNYSK